MNTLNHMPQDFRLLCESWSQSVEKIVEYEARLAYFQEALPALLLNKSLFSTIFRHIIDGDPYPEIGKATMFDNEILLYVDQNRLFSLRLYLWAPGEYTPVHDHSAWGLIGTISGSFELIKFTRQDDGSDDNYASLIEADRIFLKPGEIEVTLSLDKGIHRTGNPTDQTVATMHLYGDPVKRSYINKFDPETGRISRMYAPKARKRVLATEALSVL